MNKYILFFLTMILLTGCVANYELLKIGNVDKTNKSITVPSTGISLFEIKTALNKDGWKIKVGDSSLLETGLKDKIINSKTEVNYDTSYRLYLSYTLSNNNNDGIIRFNISIVDNRTNEEILNMVGNKKSFVRYEPKDIASNLVNALKEIQK